MAKKIGILLFSFHFLCFSTEIHEIFRVPLLLIHYFEHQEENHELTVMDFLENHYSQTSENQDSTDSNLPFKHHQQNIVIVFGLVSHIEIFRLILIPTLVAVFGDSEKHFSVKLENGVWHPPQV